jgi:diguanylate cyclase (GGDEF)-like protein
MQDQGLSTIAVNAAAVAGFYILVSQSAPKWMPLWTLLALLIAALRLVAHVWIARASRGVGSYALARWRLVYAAGLMGSALCWVVLSVAAFAGFAPRDQMALLLILSALAGGASGVLAPLRGVGALYITLLLSGGVIALMLVTPSQPVMAALGVAFLVVMLFAHARNHRILVDSLRLAGENADLINRLAAQNHRLESRIAERTQALHDMAHRDALTGLANRRRLSALECEIAPVGQAVLFIDLDHFKEINDTRGHAIGDAVLQEVARRLRLALGLDALIARWGGDEFVCVLSDLGPRHEQALRSAEAVLRGVAFPLTLEGGADAIPLAASIGVACAPEHGSSLSSLIASADLAAMQAKREGRAKALIYTPEMSASWRRRRQIEQALSVAITDNSLELHYQPIIDREGRPLQLEALLRWKVAEFGPVSPVEFIPIAEETGSIHAVGDWVLARACEDARGWQVTHPGLAVAVNVSIPQLRANDFALKVDSVLRRTGLSPVHLVLEVTESAFVETRDEQVLETLRAVAKTGVRIEVDDFGTGYSSLARLHLYPLSAIKVDRQFVSTLDESARAIVAAVRLIADRFGLKVIAEGIEEASQAEALIALGADALQGYWFGRPCPSAEVLSNLSASHWRSIDSGIGRACR